jgi:hypothetical protein
VLGLDAIVQRVEPLGDLECQAGEVWSLMDGALRRALANA